MNHAYRQFCGLLKELDYRLSVLLILFDAGNELTSCVWSFAALAATFRAVFYAHDKLADARKPDKQISVF